MSAGRDSTPPDLRRVWTIGDYPAIARHLELLSAAVLDATLPPGPGGGVRVLDVGCGDGNTAIEAARRGAAVVGIDLTPAMIENARHRAATAGVEVEFRVGDAQRLDVDDDTFDVVVSSVGVIFAPDHVAALAEMVRATTAGGRVGLTAWAADGWSAVWGAAAADLLPTPPVEGAPRPDLWSDRAEVERRFVAAGLRDVAVAHVPFEWRFADVDAAAHLFSTASGPFIAFLERADDAGIGAVARSRLREVLDRCVIADGDGVRLPHPFLLATGTA